MITGIPPTKFFETFLELSRQKGLSASIAVEEAGLHRSAVTNWRRGKLPGEKALSKLTAYFGVTRQYLLEGPPNESVTESKVESYDEQGVSSVEGEVSSTDTLEKGSRLESRSFVQFALDLLTIYCPDEEVDSFKDKMPDGVLKALKEEHFDMLPVDEEWESRFYSLLEDKNILQILQNLRKTEEILALQREKSISNKIPQIIWDYMYKEGFDFEFVMQDNSYYNVGRYRSVVRLKDSGKHWLFSFNEFTTVVPRAFRYFSPVNFEWINDIQDVERIVILFMYTKQYISDGEFSEFERRLYKTCPNEIKALLSKAPLFLCQVSSITKKLMDNQQVKLSSLPNLQVD